MVSTVSIPTNQTLPSASVALSEPHCRKVPLQGLLLNTLGLSGDRIGVVSAELLPFLGKRLEFASAGVGMDKPTLLRKRV